MKIKIAPSILSADLGNLNEEIKKVENHADMIHVDVMDGHFVPNITMGPVIVENIKSKLPLDCHLMISDPVKYADRFSQHCDMISFHAELFEGDLEGLKNAINKIKKNDVKIGLALNPNKSLDIILPVLDVTDYILIMSVKAGFSGQKFMSEVLKKVEALRNEYNYTKDIEIDGGINDKTVKKAVDAGANIIVAGSFVYGSTDPVKSIKLLKEAVK